MKERLLNFQKNYGINVLKKEDELNGSFRFFAEKFLTPLECQQLMDLEVYKGLLILLFSPERVPETYTCPDGTRDKTSQQHAARGEAFELGQNKG